MGKRGRRAHLVDDSDVFGADFNVFDEEAEDLALAGLVGLVEGSRHALGEGSELADEQA